MTLEVEDRATAVDDNVSTIPGIPITINVLDNDLGTPQIEDISQPDNGSVVIDDNDTPDDPTDDAIIYTPDPEFAGTDSFTYTIIDDEGNPDTATVTVVVDPVQPNAGNDIATTPPGSPITINVLINDTDPNGDIPTIVDFTPPTVGEIVINPDGTITYTPDDGFTGTDTFTYTISDPAGNTDTGTVSVTVGDIDDDSAPPIAEDDNGNTPIGVPINFNVLVNDSDPNGDPLIITDFTDGLNGTVSQNDSGTPTDPTDDFLTYTPNLEFSGIDIFTYTIDDGNGGTDTATVTVEVANQGAAVDDTASTTPNTPVVINILDNDSGTPQLGEITQPENGSVVIDDNGTPTDPTDDVIIYTPNPEFTGIDTFTYIIIDDEGNPDTGTVIVNVDPQQPIVGDDIGGTGLGEPITINVLVNDSDPNGDPLTIVDVTTPTSGIVIVNGDGTITYIPDEGFFGTDTFIYTVIDDDGNTNSGSVSVTVGADDPTTIPPIDGVSLVQGGNDIFVIEGPAGGNASLKFTLTEAAADFVNEVGVYTVSDLDGTVNGIAPGEDGYQEAVLESGTVIFSALSDTPDLFGEDPMRIIDGFETGDQLGFYLVSDSTTDTILFDPSTTTDIFFSPNAANADGIDHSNVSNLEENVFLIEWEDTLGGTDFDFNDLGFVVSITDELPPLGNNLQGSFQGEVIDLTSVAGSEVQVNFEEFSNADLNNLVGFYVVEDLSGTITDAVTGLSLSPGDAGYADAAIEATVAELSSDTTLTLDGGEIYASYLVAEGEGIFFPFLEENADGLDHLRLLGDNTFGFEDTLGGGDNDFNDFVYSIEATVV